MFEIVFASRMKKLNCFERDMNFGGLVQQSCLFFYGGSVEMQFIVEGKTLTTEVLSSL